MTDQLLLPIIDIAPLRDGGAGRDRVAREMAEAAREEGFFYIRNHGVDEGLQAELEQLSRAFFSLPLEDKMAVRMALGGKAWRGYFPVGGELTSGRPDRKEGLYFGAELAASHPAVRAGLLLYGPNLFPREPKRLRAVVLEYLTALTQLGHVLMRGLALSLGLDGEYFHDSYTRDPFILFRIFHYPPAPADAGRENDWGVGEHTDYGILTILKQDDCGGLQVKGRKGWIEAPPVAGTFVCNLGDMLDKLTGGLYRSTPHRVRNTSGRSRLSFPFFFDPNLEAEVKPIPTVGVLGGKDDSQERWDRANVHAFKGKYGDYFRQKIAKVFPELEKKVLG